MNLETFEPLLCDALTAHPDVARTWTMAETGHTRYGVMFRLTDGTAAWARLTAGSGPKPTPGTPRTGEKEMPPQTSLPLDVADRLESLLRVAVETADLPGVAWVMTLHERRSERLKGKPAQGLAPAGLVIGCDNGDEVYVYLYG